MEPIRDMVIVLVFGGEPTLGRRMLIHRLMYSKNDYWPACYRERLDNEARQLGLEPSFAVYWQQRQLERLRGLTEPSIVSEFSTPSRRYYINDNPSHKSFLRYHLSGASGLGAAVLLLDAAHRDWDGGTSDSNSNDTERVKRKRHSVEGNQSESYIASVQRELQLLYLLDMHHLVVAINNMDTVAFSQSRFESIKAQVIPLLESAGWSQSFLSQSVPFIPVCVLEGDNICHTTNDAANGESGTNRMPWWRGASLVLPCRNVIHVDTLIDALEWLPLPFLERSLSEKSHPQAVSPTSGKRLPPLSDLARLSLRVPISGAYTIKGIGHVLTGTVMQGRLCAGQEVVCLPSGRKATVVEIDLAQKRIEEALPGYNCGYHVKGPELSKTSLPKVGELICLPADAPKQVRSFVAHVRVIQYLPSSFAHENLNPNVSLFDAKGRLCIPIGFPLGVMVRTTRSRVTLAAINWRRGRQTGDMKEPWPLHVGLGDDAEIVLQADAPLVVEPFRLCGALGLVALMPGSCYCLLGKVVTVTTEEEFEMEEK